MPSSNPSRVCPVSAPATFPGFLIVPPAPVIIEQLALTPFPATAGIDTFAPLGVYDDLVLSVPCFVLALLSVFLSASGSQSDVAIGIDASGATVGPVDGSRCIRQHLDAPQVLEVTLTMQALVACQAGTTRLEVMHAGDAGTVSNLVLTVIPLFPIQE